MYVLKRTFSSCAYGYNNFSQCLWKFLGKSKVFTREGNGTPLQYSCLENSMDGEAWWAAVHGVAKSRIQLSDFTLFFHFHALEKEMATHSSVLAWRIPGTGEPGGLPSMGSHRVRHDWSDLAIAKVFTESVDMNLSKLQEIVKDKGDWHSTVPGVAKSWTQLSHWTTTKYLPVDCGFDLLLGKWASL